MSDKALDYNEMEKAKECYYQLMGWGARGIPRAEKLEELGIDHL